MCGIVGIVLRDPTSTPSALKRADNALTALKHRGPDTHGRCASAGVILGHTRLSILDLSDAGHQPMETADGRYAITYNGECYNFREVARDLGIGGFRSGSDTEVVLRVFAAEGLACLPRLNGMFAFAVHDRSAGSCGWSETGSESSRSTTRSIPTPFSSRRRSARSSNSPARRRPATRRCSPSGSTTATPWAARRCSVESGS